MKNKFKNSCFIKCCSEHLIGQLNILGYKESPVAGDGRYVITTPIGYFYYTNCDYSNGGMGYVCETEDEGLKYASELANN